MDLKIWGHFPQRLSKQQQQKISRQYYFSNVLCWMNCLQGHFENKLLKSDFFFCTWRIRHWESVQKMINVHHRAIITKWAHLRSLSRTINKTLSVSQKEVLFVCLSIDIPGVPKENPTYLCAWERERKRESGSRYGEMLTFGEARWMVYECSFHCWGGLKISA